jgi:hypothetical protein
LQVRSLEGYVAPRGQPSRARTPNTVLAAVWDAVASPVTTSGVPIRVFAAPFRGAGGNATVVISLEIAASKLNLVQRDGAYRGELEMIFAVTDAKKRKWPMMRHRATLALKPATFERVTRSGLRVVSHVALPEGRYQLRVSAGGAAVAGSVIYDLTVPDFHDDFALSGVVLTSSRVGEALTVLPDPHAALPVPAVPTTAREFSRDDVLLLYAEAYDGRRQPHTVDFEVELRDESGKVLATHAADAQKGDAADPTVHRLTQRIALDEVPPGRYTIHVEARSSLDGRTRPSRDIPIIVER